MARTAKSKAERTTVAWILGADKERDTDVITPYLLIGVIYEDFDWRPVEATTLTREKLPLFSAAREAPGCLNMHSCKRSELGLVALSPALLQEAEAAGLSVVISTSAKHRQVVVVSAADVKRLIEAVGM
ncbi:MAG TPA: hypothetical protein VFZ03_18745 [Dongiaceae bacterium]